MHYFVYSLFRYEDAIQIFALLALLSCLMLVLSCYIIITTDREHTETCKTDLYKPLLLDFCVLCIAQQHATLCILTRIYTCSNV